MAGEIIRQGDPTSHGGKVLEGSILDICHGKPISFVGHKVSCPRCKGIFPIVEGAPTTTFYGKGVALAGMKTACGAVLIATQFLDIVEVGGGSSEHRTAQRTNSTKDAPNCVSAAQGNVGPSSATNTAASELDEEHSYMLVDETGNAADDYCYDLHCDDLLHTKAARYLDGATVSVTNIQTSRLVCWLAKDGAAKS